MAIDEYVAAIDAETHEQQPSLKAVQRALSKIPGSLSDDIRAERERRG